LPLSCSHLRTIAFVFGGWCLWGGCSRWLRNYLFALLIARCDVLLYKHECCFVVYLFLLSLSANDQSLRLLTVHEQLEIVFKFVFPTYVQEQGLRTADQSLL